MLLLIFLLCIPGSFGGGVTTLNNRHVHPGQHKSRRIRLPVDVSRDNFLDSVSSSQACFRHDHGRGSQGNVTDTCTTPVVPDRLFHRKPYCQKSVCHKRETCLIIAENIMAHYGAAFDAVFFHADLCSQHHGLRPGNLTRSRVNQLLPAPEQLVGLNLNGTDFLKVLLQGFVKDPAEAAVEQFQIPTFLNSNTEKTCKSSPIDRFPILSGVKLEVSKDAKGKNKGVYDVRILSSDCTWKELDLHASYSILTTRSLAMGKYGYGAMTKSFGFWNTGQTVRDVFWQQARSTCAVQQPVPHPLCPNCGQGRPNLAINGRPTNKLNHQKIIRKSDGSLINNTRTVTQWIGQASL